MPGPLTMPPAPRHGRARSERSGDTEAMLIYRLLVTLALPVLLARFVLLRLTGREPPGALAERLGMGSGPTGRGPLIWLHGASNGELASARPVVAGLLSDHPDLRLLVTANTVTGRQLVEGWDQPRVAARLAPVDIGWLLSRFLSRWRPAALVTIESELWPNRLALAGARGLPVLLIGARLSERSARRWQARAGLWRAIAPAIRYLSAQDQASEGRFRGLGLPAATIGPVLNLKSLIPAPPAGAAADAAARHPGRPHTVLAASTHEGEEELVLDALAPQLLARQTFLILAPRHPHRRDEILALIAARGLAHAVRSQGAGFLAEPGAPPVYLADTMGEMALWYQAAGLTFVGGSLVDRGGHTPYEPAAQGSAILHGPHVANFEAAYAQLDREKGACRAEDGAGLARLLAGLVGDRAAQEALAANARAALASLAARPEGLLSSILAEIARLARL